MIVDSSNPAHWNTHENRHKLTLTGSSVVERSCVANSTHALAIHYPVYTGEDNHHESQSSVAYPIYDEVGQAHLYQTSQPEGNSSLSQIPFPCLVPQPTVGRAQTNINGMQELNLYSKPSVVQSSDCQQGLQCAVSDQIVVVPTDPVTGYSTMLRTDKARANPSQDLAYESSKMNDRPSTINQDASGMSLQSNISYCKLASYSQSPSSTSASNILSPTSIDSNVPHSTCPQLGFPSPSLTDTPMVPADLESEVGYTILRDGRPQAPTGQGPIPVYNTIDLKGVCPPVGVNNDTVILQANDSHGNTHSSDSQSDPSSKFLKSGASVSLSYISP